MKKTIRIIFGCIFIACGVCMGLFRLSIYPHPFNWGELLLVFAPAFLVAIALLAAGWGVVVGMTWRELLENLSYIWH
jgi:hypothetical protein